MKTNFYLNKLLTVTFMMFLLLSDGSNALKKSKLVSEKTKEQTTLETTVHKAQLLANEGLYVGRLVGLCMKSFTKAVPPAFCWKSSFDYGRIASNCPSGWTNSMSLCYRNCPDGYKFLFGTCFGSKGYLPDALYTDTVTALSDIVQCPAGYYKVLGMCFRDCTLLGLVNCGPEACAANSSTCLSQIITMGINGFIAAFTVAIMVASAGTATPAAKPIGDAVRRVGVTAMNDGIKLFMKNMEAEAKKTFMQKAMRYLEGQLLEAGATALVESSVKAMCKKSWDTATNNVSPSTPITLDSVTNSVMNAFGINAAVDACSNQNAPDWGVSCARKVAEAVGNIEPTGLVAFAATFINPLCDDAAFTPSQADYYKVNQNDITTFCPNCVDRETVKSVLNNKHLVWLSKHNVDCGPGRALNAFKILSSSALDKLQIKYRCVESSNISSTDCYTSETASVTFTYDGSVDKLKDAPVQCSNYYMLNSFLFTYTDSPMKFKIIYKCCKSLGTYVVIGYNTPLQVVNLYDLENINDLAAVDAGTKDALGGFNFQSNTDNKYLWVNYNQVNFSYGNQDTSIQNKWTDWNDSDEGNIYYLDRHDIRCGNNQAISYFKLERSGNNIRFAYNCANSSIITTSCYDSSTQWNATDNDRKKSVHFLDRHNVNCNDNYVLNQFKLGRNGDNINIGFKCCYANYKKVYQGAAPWTALGDYSTFYLERQYIFLGPESVLKSFKLKANFNKDYIFRFTYDVALLK